MIQEWHLCYIPTRVDESMPKRKDLQGIRGVAMSSVLLYHYFPEAFPNGYVGVDQFFLLSGFLMAEILSRDNSLSPKVLPEFYYRRLKRILPLYALFILCTLSASLFLFPESTFKLNVSHSIRSLFFISNTKQEDPNQTYERMLEKAENLYTHTWSLSCEVQFYLMAPFLILAPRIPKSALTALCAITSFLLMSFNFVSGDPYFAFNSVFSRIWQFSLGILCSQLKETKENKADEEECLVPSDTLKEKDMKYTTAQLLMHDTITISVLILSWYPVEISPSLVRIFVSCQTAILIYVGESMPNSFLCNRFLVYLGDISYSLYLIHWPVYAFLKQNQWNSITGCHVAIFGCIAAAAFVYETYEKFYLKLEKRFIIFLTVLLYCCCIAVLTPNIYKSYSKAIKLDFKIEAAEDDVYYKLPENLTLDDAIKLNSYMSGIEGNLNILKECEYSQFRPGEKAPFAMCHMNKTIFSGDKLVMLVGNSWSAMMGRMFVKLKECQENAGDVYMYPKYGCETLEDHPDASCKGSTQSTHEAIEKIKPDILIINVRQMTAATFPPTNGSKDVIFEAEKAHLERIEKAVKKKVYILNAVPETHHYVGPFNKEIKEKGFIENQLKFIDHGVNYTLARERVTRLGKICKKCEIFDIMPSFMRNGTFHLYNETTNVVYFGDSLHLNDYGLQLISPVYRKLCREM